MSVEINSNLTSSIFNSTKSNSNANQNRDDFLSSWAKQLGESMDKAVQEAKLSGHDERNAYNQNSQQKAQTNLEKALNAVKNISNGNTGEKIEFESLSLEDQEAILEWLSQQLEFQEKAQRIELDIASVEMRMFNGELRAFSTFKTTNGEELKGVQMHMGSPVFGDKKAKSEAEIVKEKQRIEEVSKHTTQTSEEKIYDETLQNLIQAYLEKSKEKLEFSLNTFLLNHQFKAPKADENIAQVLKQI